MSFAAMVPLISAGIGAAGSVAGGLLSQSGNQGASGVSAQTARDLQTAGNTALTEAGNQSSQDRAGLSSWVSGGAGATGLIGSLLGLGKLTPTGDAWGTATFNPNNWQQDQQNAMARFQTDPGYQFRMSQGVNALNQSAAARGTQLSGAQRRALSDYGQNSGSQEYANWFNRLAGMSGQGLTAENAANTASNNIMNTGIDAQMKGALGAAGVSQQGAGYGVAGQNALASGIVGAGNSLAAGGMATPWGSIFGNSASQPSPVPAQGNPYWTA